MATGQALYPVVSAKLTAAYKEVNAAGGRTALTLYYNVGCGDGPGELSPLAFSPGIRAVSGQERA
jgi:hypothetical protein